MSDFTLKVRRRLRRWGFGLLVVVVWGLMLIGWLSDRWYDLTEVVVRWLHLRRVEDWLRRGPLWIGLLFLVPLGAGWVVFKIYGLHLILDGNWVLAVGVSLLFKVVYLTVFHWLVHIYAEKLLAIRWVHWLYSRYLAVRERVLGWMRAQPWYRLAANLKRRALRYIRRRSLWLMARRWVGHA